MDNPWYHQTEIPFLPVWTICQDFLGGGGGAMVGGGPILNTADKGTTNGLSLRGMFSYNCKGSSGGLDKNRTSLVTLKQLLRTSSFLLYEGKSEV